MGTQLDGQPEEYIEKLYPYPDVGFGIAATLRPF